LVLYVVGGSGAGLVDTIYALLAFRMVLGIGVGLMMLHSTGLIAYYFAKSEQAKLMGYSIAMNNLGGIIATVLSGYLVSLNWRFTFAIYLLGFIVMVLVLLYLPKTELKRDTNKLDKAVLRTIMPYVLTMFIVMVVFYTVPSSFAMIAAQAALAPTAWIGVLMAVKNVTAFLAGISLSFLVRKFGRYTQYFGSAMLILAFFALWFTGSIVLVILGLIALGIGMGTVAPILNAQIALNVERGKITPAMAVMSAMLFLGQFLSPVIIDGVQSILHLRGIQTPYDLAMILSVLLCIAFTRIPVSTEIDG